MFLSGVVAAKKVRTSALPPASTLLFFFRGIVCGTKEGSENFLVLYFLSFRVPTFFFGVCAAGNIRNAAVSGPSRERRRSDGPTHVPWCAAALRHQSVCGLRRQIVNASDNCMQAECGSVRTNFRMERGAWFDFIRQCKVQGQQTKRK